MVLAADRFGGNAKLVKVIMRDSLWYFFVLFCESIVALGLYTGLPAKHAALRSVLTDQARAFATIIASRMILNLRNAADPEAGLTVATYTLPHSIWEHRDGLDLTDTVDEGEAA